MNFLILTISPYSNPEEYALPKRLIGFDHSIEIWLAEVARAFRPPVAPRGNNFAKRKGGPQNVVGLVILIKPLSLWNLIRRLHGLRSVCMSIHVLSYVSVRALT
jgi:hypothetical protein